MQKIDLQLDVISFNAAISACGKSNQWVLALQLLDDLHRSRLQSDQISFNAALAALGACEDWHIALQLLIQMDHCRLQRDAISFNEACTPAWDPSPIVFIYIYIYNAMFSRLFFLSLAFLNFHVCSFPFLWNSPAQAMPHGGGRWALPWLRHSHTLWSLNLIAVLLIVLPYSSAEHIFSRTTVSTVDEMALDPPLKKH